MITLHRPADVGPAVRGLLTVGLLGAATLSAQAWLSTHGRHSAAALGLAALAPVLLLALALAGGVALTVLVRPKQTVRWALLVLAGSGILLALWTTRPVLAAVSGLGLSIVLTWPGLWWEMSDRRASRRAYWILASAAGSFLLLSLVLDHPRGFLLTVAGLILLAVLTATVWGLLLLARNAPLPAGSGPILSAYRDYAHSGISPFTLTHDKSYFWNEERTAFLAYAARAGVAVVLGPGVGPAGKLPALYREFRAESHRRGWRIAFYQVSQEMADELGWGKRYRLGDEAIVELNGLTLEGSAMAKLRHEVSRAIRQGVTVQVVPSTDVSQETRQAMEALAATWATRRALGKMAFSVGSDEDPPSVPTTVGLARDAAGRLIAYTTWYELPGAGGLVLDQFRRQPGAPGGAMHLLLYTVMTAARSTSSWASLGLAPAGGPGAGSLSAFKTKFRPRWEPRYMLVERLRDWPEAAVATLLLHYPELADLPKRLLPLRLGRKDVPC